MSLNYPSVGEGYAPAYQVSALPFVTSSLVPANSTVEVEFSNITRFFTIKNAGENSMSFGFTENGVLGTNKFPLAKGETYIGEIRTTRLWLSGSSQETTCAIVAGLTNIPARFASPLTGSGVG